MRSLGATLVIVGLTAVVVAALFAWLVRTGLALGAVTHRMGGARMGLVLLGAALGALVGEVLLALSESWSASSFAWDPADGAKNACDPMGYAACLGEALPVAGAGAAGGAVGGQDKPYESTRPYAYHEGPPIEHVGPERSQDYQEMRDEYAHKHRDTTPSPPPSKYDQGKQTFIRSILTGGGKANR